jgi:hypothetical protein
MKKKIILSLATCLFAVATVLNMNLLQANSAGDVSLESITVMAQAQSNGETTPVPPAPYCYLVHVGNDADGCPLVSCGQSSYPDHTGVICDCFAGTRNLCD